MKTINITELENNFDKYFDSASMGEDIEVIIDKNESVVFISEEKYNTMKDIESGAGCYEKA